MMPIIGNFTGGMDFADLKYVFTAESVGADGAVVKENAIRYGAWINSIINLLIVGLVLFFMVKAYNKTKTPEPEAAPAGPTQEELLAQIRDLLKK